MHRMRLLTVSVVWLGLSARGSGTAGPKAEIEQFNQRFVTLHLKGDHAGVLKMWAEDGVDLMPGEAPLIGKPAIAAWVENIQASLPGHRVTREDVEFHDICVSGDWASEWATEHQVVQLGNRKAPIEAYGKLALVLHREGNGEWKIKQEMWNDTPHP